MADRMQGDLHIGDNLAILRKHVASNSVALCYLDPPFNSARDYLAPGHAAPAFRDTWKWSPASELDFRELLRTADVGQLADIMRLLCETTPKSTAAYLVMMASRLVEIRRALRPTGSLYLHCDTSAVHHLHVILDALFGPERFLGRIVWKRSHAHNGAGKYGAVHDAILCYSKGAQYTWHPPAACSDFWDDIPPLNSRGGERSGYPTQKPIALLTRIIEASSDEGDLVLDPFCGSGTTLIAAQRLGRRWIGIDSGELARSFIERRFRSEPAAPRAREAANG